jgi:hypothetical protein
MCHDYFRKSHSFKKVSSLLGMGILFVWVALKIFQHSDTLTEDCLSAGNQMLREGVSK